MTHSIEKQPLNRALAATMAMLLAFPASILAQTPQVAVSPTQSLRILPLAGNNAMNDVERGIMAPLAVQILDARDLPVEGATVTFRFPLNGPSAVYADQQTVQTVRTGANGQARSTGWTANKQLGSFQVQVTATRGNEQGVSPILLTNVTRILPGRDKSHKRWWTSKWVKIGIIAGAAAIAGGVALRGSGSTTITGVAGIPTIGGPQ